MENIGKKNDLDNNIEKNELNINDLIIEDIKEDTILVIECSSYQLEMIHYSPHIGLVLNLFEDHLIYHINHKKFQFN